MANYHRATLSTFSTARTERRYRAKLDLNCAVIGDGSDGRAYFVDTGSSIIEETELALGRRQRRLLMARDWQGTTLKLNDGARKDYCADPVDADQVQLVKRASHRRTMADKSREMDPKAEFAKVLTKAVFALVIIDGIAALLALLSTGKVL